LLVSYRTLANSSTPRQLPLNVGTTLPYEADAIVLTNPTDEHRRDA